MNRYSNWLNLALSILLVGCASINPNPGERSADKYWMAGNYAEAIAIVTPQAELGEPWAQLRLAIYYDVGNGVAKDPAEAAKWYKKAALQTAEGRWAEGRIFATGKVGYYSQRNDALIAQHRLAVLHSSGTGVELDLVKAYLLANNVSKKSNGKSVFFCCAYKTVPTIEYDSPRGEVSEGPHRRSGRWFTAEKIARTLSAIEDAMTEQQLAQARKLAETWSPATGL